jgi:hypothetical protein
MRVRASVIESPRAETTRSPLESDDEAPGKPSAMQDVVGRDLRCREPNPETIVSGRGTGQHLGDSSAKNRDDSIPALPRQVSTNAPRDETSWTSMTFREFRVEWLDRRSAPGR